MPTPFGDSGQPFQIEAPGLRGRLVRLSASLDGVMHGRSYPPPVAAMLAEILVLTAILGSGLKFDGIFTLQIQGDGPLGLVVADLTSDGDLRGYARCDTDRLTEPGPTPEGPVPRLLGAGHMAFTVDQGPHTERYQGVTALEGATLSDCAHAYFRRSEQLETAIILCSAGTAGSLGTENETDAGGNARRAAALMLQRLPPELGIDADADEDWRRSVILMSSVSTAELLDPSISPEQLLYRLFHEDGVRLFKARPLRHKCRCSRSRVATTLRSFPRAEIASLAEDGVVRVRCEFCGVEYAFDDQALDLMTFQP